MSEIIDSDTIFLVTNTKSLGTESYDEYGWTVTYPEGSLGHALVEAEGCASATIVFSSSLSGKTITYGRGYMEGDGIAVHPLYLSGNVSFENNGSKPVTIKAGVCEYGCCAAYLNINGNATIGEGIKLSTDIKIGGNIHLEETVVNSTLHLANTSTISGEDIIFAGKIPLCLTMHQWDGSAEALQTELDRVFADGADYTITAKSAMLGLNARLETSVTISEGWKAAILPEGFSDVAFSLLSILDGSSVTIERGTRLNLLPDASLDVETGGSLLINPGTQLACTQKSGIMSIACSGGTLTVNGVNLSGIDCYLNSGEVLITNCWGSGYLHLDSYGSSNITITGCDLSRVDFYAYGEDIGNVNLSGNYWGKNASVSSIKKKLMAELGYVDETTEQSITQIAREAYDSRLTKAPAKPGLTPPSLKLSKPTLVKADEGMVDATLRWSGEKNATYTLYVDGEKVLEDSTDTSYLFTGEDGAHSYTVIAKDAAGNPTTKTGSFTFDATAPDAPSEAEASFSFKKNSGKGKVTLEWDDVEDDSSLRYTVEIEDMEGNRRKVYSGRKDHCSFTVADGTWYYSITATDAAGNTSEAYIAEFTFDATAPEILLMPPSKSTEDGETVHNLWWYSDGESTYKLEVKGKGYNYVDEDSESQVSLSGLADGKYTYTITATDAAGNTTRRSDSFYVDNDDNKAPDAPTILVASAKKTGTDQSTITLKWKGEKDAYYMFEDPDGAPLYIKGTSCTFKGVADGEYEFFIYAIDKAGNIADESTDVSVTCDTLAPEILSTGYMAGSENGKPAGLVLAWQSEEGWDEGTTFTIKVDGKTIKNASIIENSTEDNMYTYVHAKTLSAGKHSYSITATDAHGNSSTYKGSFSTLTLSKPVLSGGEAEGTMNATLKWKAQEGITYTISVDGQEEVEVVDSKSGDKYITHELTNMADGEHSYTVYARDEDGNTLMNSGSFSFDNTAPNIILSSLSGQLSKNKVKVTFSWVGEDGVSYRIKLNNGKTLTAGKLGYTTAALAQGDYSFLIFATDKAGNSRMYDGEVTVGVVNGEAQLEWKLNDQEAAPTLPSSARNISWVASTDENEAGIQQTTYSSQESYSFTLETARQLDIKLSMGMSDATVRLIQLDPTDDSKAAAGVIELSAHAGTVLDRELSLSAGTYYLQVESCNGSSLDAYTLDLELEKNGKKQPLSQGIIA